MTYFQRNVWRLLGLTCLLTIPALSQAQVAPPAPDGTSESDVVKVWYTRPSDQRELSFETPGVVGQVLVKEGDPVKEGQLLAIQRVEQDETELAALEKDAQSTVQIDAAKLTLEEKEVEFERIDKIHREGGQNDLEWQKAKLEVRLAQQDILKAELEQELKQLKADKQLIHTNLMYLHSPIKGLIVKIDAKAGEMATVDRAKPSYVIVKNDPLWVEMHLPAAGAQKLKDGDPVQVSHDGVTWETGKVFYHAPVADAASGTQLVRLELPNPQNRSSGLQVRVKLPRTVLLPNGADQSAGVR